ncbi:MAG: hypothetical protein QOK85_00685 [Nitrososphaeraceae archaeon]|nr:hypothetical protein [Nitrososphaeraceae archaeon]
MMLEKLRDKAFFQNTIDVWMAYCEESGIDWYSIEGYRSFISYLNLKGLKMQKFPLCIKESGGLYERGKDKAKFLEELSHFSDNDSSAYTLKLSSEVIDKIRSYNLSEKL